MADEPETLTLLNALLSMGDTLGTVAQAPFRLGADIATGNPQALQNDSRLLEELIRRNAAREGKQKPPRLF